MQKPLFMDDVRVVRVLVKLFLTLLILNLCFAASQVKADYRVDEYRQQNDLEFALNANRFVGENVISGVQITRADCLRRAIADLLSKLGIVADSDKDLGIVIAKTRRNARFGQMKIQSDYLVTVSDRAIKLEFGWKF